MLVEEPLVLLEQGDQLQVRRPQFATVAQAFRISLCFRVPGQWLLNSNELVTASPNPATITYSGSPAIFAAASVNGVSSPFTITTTWQSGLSAAQAGDAVTIEFAAGALQDAAGNQVVRTVSTPANSVVFGMRLLCA